MKIKQRFRGLNLLEDPSQISPGESLVCRDLYIKGKKLVSRNKSDFFVTNLGEAYTEIKYAYVASNINANQNYLFCIDTDGDVYRFLSDNAGNWIYSGEQPISLGSLVPNDDPDRSVRFLEWENKLIVFRGPYVFVLTNDFKWSQLPGSLLVKGSPTILFNGTTGSVEFERVSYIIEFYSTNTGFHFYLHNTMPIGSTQADNGTIFLTKINTSSILATDIDIDTGSFVSLYQDRLQDAKIDKVRVYRKLTYADGSVDNYYYLLDEEDFDPLNNSSYQYNDDDLSISSTGQETFDTSLVESNGVVRRIPSDLTCAGWYQGRVAWCTERGTITFSSLYNPFISPGELIDNAVTSSKSYKITNFVEYLGTGIIFTNKGIYHLVGEIADRADDSTYRFYEALPGYNCLSLPSVPIIEDELFFITINGIYLYDARRPKFLGDKIRSLWEGYNRENLYQLSTAIDYENKLLLINIPGYHVLVYHFANHFSGEVPMAGEWTTWLDEDVELVFNITPAYDEDHPGKNKFYSLPAYIDKTKNDYRKFNMLSTDASNENLNVEWKSQYLDGNTLSVKRWLKFLGHLIGNKFQVEVSQVLATKIADTELITNVTVPGRHLHKARLRGRSNSIQLIVTAQEAVELIDFEVTGELIG